jgi:hypothetical protein
MCLTYGHANDSDPRAARLYQEIFPRQRHPNYERFEAINCRRKQLSLLLSIGKRVTTADTWCWRACPGPFWREVGCKREVNSDRIHCRANYRLESTEWAITITIQFTVCPGPQECRKSSKKYFVKHRAEFLFLLAVLFSEEAGFGRDGIINFHNHYQWAEDNPYGVLQTRYQQQFSINVWAGALGDC